MERIQTIVETGIYVDDLAKAESFYQGVLGLDVITRDEKRHVFFQVGNSSVLLVFLAKATMAGDTLPAHGTSGPGHFALGIPKAALDDWKRRLAQHDVAIEQEVQWPRGGTSIYFRDPAGNSVELLTPGLWGIPSGW